MSMTVLPARTKRLDSNHYVEGYATTWEPYLLYDGPDGPIYEQFERSSFDKCDMSDVIMQYDHMGRVFARIRNKTLIVEPDDIGLFTAADLGRTEAARGLYEDIKEEMSDRMSWSFISKNPYFDRERRTIVHREIIKIFDVSAVSIPANDNTNIHARSQILDGEIERVRQELLLRERTLLKIKLGGF